MSTFTSPEDQNPAEPGATRITDAPAENDIDGNISVDGNLRESDEVDGNRSDPPVEGNRSARPAKA